MAEFERKVGVKDALEYSNWVALMDAKVRGEFDRELARQLWDRAVAIQQEQTPLAPVEICMLHLIEVIFEAEQIL